LRLLIASGAKIYDSPDSSRRANYVTIKGRKDYDFERTNPTQR